MHGWVEVGTWGLIYMSYTDKNRLLNIISDDVCDAIFGDKWIGVALRVLEITTKLNQVTFITL